MLDFNEKRKVIEAYRKINPLTVLQHLVFENSTLFNLGNMHIHKGWAYYREGKSIYRGAVNLGNPNTNPDEFLKLLEDKEMHNIERLYMEDTHESPLTCNVKHKSSGHMFIYDDKPDFINRVGKDYHRFRTSYEYQKIEGFEVDMFFADRPITTSAFYDVVKVNTAWANRLKENGSRPAYDPNRVIENILKDNMADYLVSIVYYKGVPIHYHSSDRLNSNFAVLLDSKVNFSVDEEVAKKFRYCNFLQHWMYCKYWSFKKSNDYKMYFHTGLTPLNSYKQQLRPDIISKSQVVMVQDLDFIKRETVESSSLF